MISLYIIFIIENNKNLTFKIVILKKKKKKKKEGFEMIDLINYNNNNNKQVIVFITDTYTQKLVKNETIILFKTQNFASTIILIIDLSS